MLEIFRLLAITAGVIIVAGTLFSAVETFVLPRSAPDSLTRFVFLFIRKLFEFRLLRSDDYQRNDRVMAMYAPISLLALLPTWYAMTMFGYTLIFWGAGIPTLTEALRESISSLLTLGFAVPQGVGLSLLVGSEAIIGLILVALLIAYLPTMYSAFSRREAAVTMLEVRAGDPPSVEQMLERYHRIHGLQQLNELWKTWEIWFADVEESHSSLPALVFFRSPQPNHSWVTSAGAVLDSAAFTLSAVNIPPDPQAMLCIRAGYLCLQRISSFFSINFDPKPKTDAPISIQREEFNSLWEKLGNYGIPLKADQDQAWRDYAGWRVNYDVVLLALASLTMAPIAPWSSDRGPLQKVSPFSAWKKH